MRINVQSRKRASRKDRRKSREHPSYLSFHVAGIAKLSDPYLIKGPCPVSTIRRDDALYTPRFLSTFIPPTRPPLPPSLRPRATRGGGASPWLPSCAFASPSLRIPRHTAVLGSQRMAPRPVTPVLTPPRRPAQTAPTPRRNAAPGPRAVRASRPARGPLHAHPCSRTATPGLEPPRRSHAALGSMPPDKKARARDTRTAKNRHERREDRCARPHTGVNTILRAAPFLNENSRSNDGSRGRRLDDSLLREDAHGKVSCTYTLHASYPRGCGARPHTRVKQ